MSIPFRELGGSPCEWYDAAGFHARREFLVAWADRDAFALYVLGEAAEFGGSTQVNYPGKAHVFAVKLRYEPADPDQPDVKELTEIDQELNSYADSWAKAIVEYRTVNPRDREDGPENEPGTYLTYRMRYLGAFQPVGPGGWMWSDTYGAVPSTQELAKWIPMTEHLLTWHQVVNPPWQTISELQGTLNDAEFLGCAAGTLLFEGADANKLYRAGLDEGPSPFCWEIAYLFRERAIKSGGSVFGWNHAYRENPAGWVTVTNGSANLHDSADFSPLFESAEE
ncbi:MAG: hypothetical protein JW818_10285 [Pirellulales bacterium]|nr:hypothetical protein [Pirellulales bacterium]